MEKYFTRAEAIETLIETLDGYTGYYEDLHSEAFNSTYYIVGTYVAKQALTEYGVFDAIGKVVQFEEDNFGEVTIDVTEPEHIANVLWYIVTYEFMYNIEELCDAEGLADDETNERLIEILKNELGKEDK